MGSSSVDDVVTLASVAVDTLTAMETPPETAAGLVVRLRDVLVATPSPSKCVGDALVATVRFMLQHTTTPPVPFPPLVNHPTARVALAATVQEDVVLPGQWQTSLLRRCLSGDSHHLGDAICLLVTEDVAAFPALNVASAFSHRVAEGRSPRSQTIALRSNVSRTDSRRFCARSMPAQRCSPNRQDVWTNQPE